MKKTAHHEDQVGNNIQIAMTLKGVTPQAIEDRTWVCKYHQEYSAGYLSQSNGTRISELYSTEEAKNLFNTWFSRELHKEYS